MSSFLATTRMMNSTCRRNAVAAANSLSQGSSLLGSSSSSATRAMQPLSARFISTNGQESVGRFLDALEDYRAKNYAQTIPPRFRKEIITGFLHTSRTMSSMSEPNTITATMPISVDEQKKVAVLDIERFLQNIGAFGGDKVTHEDVETIVSELGESVRAEEGIRADKIVTKLF